MKSNNYPLPSLFLLFVVVVFFFLANEAQGIRLANGMIKLVGKLEKTLEEGSSLEGVRKITLCENRHCNSGINRKLLTVTSPTPLSPTPSTRIIMKKEITKKGNPKSSNKEEASVKKKGNMEINSEAISKNIEGSLDLVDIAEMDYSPAKRKPPIHN